MDIVELVPCDPKWPVLFEREAATLREILRPGLVDAIEHFGSTAVPGLSAKPVIDIMVLAPSVEEAREDGVGPLEELGYSFWRDNPQTDRLFFVKGLPPNGPRTHHVHIVTRETVDPRSGGHVFADCVLFRDYLRAHRDEVERYARLKAELSVKFRDDREAYTNGKSEYVQSVLVKARRSEMD